MTLKPRSSHGDILIVKFILKLFAFRKSSVQAKKRVNTILRTRQQIQLRALEFLLAKNAQSGSSSYKWPEQT